MPKKSTQILLILSVSFLIVLALQVSAQSEQILDPASVSGTVSVAGKPAENVSLGIFRASDDSDAKPLSTVKTDAEGSYLIENIPFGSYYLRAEFPGYVSADENGQAFVYGKAIILGAGEKLKDIDIQLVRGGVITGRLTDADGRPIIGVGILLETFNDQGERTYARYDSNGGVGLTDDRGIYRFYGLPAEKYIVSYGINTKAGGVVNEFGDEKKTFYPLVFYPSVTIEKEAKIIELGVGDVAENIDIRMGEKGSAFSIAGRLLKEDTGRPFEKEIVFLFVSPAERTSNTNISNILVKPDGSFESNGILPGKYVIEVRIVSDNSSDYVAPKTTVEIVDKNIDGLEINAKKGLSISGRVLLENKSSGNMPVALSYINLIIFGDQFGNDYLSYTKEAKIDEDGSFRFTGLEPGELELTTGNRIPGLRIAKIEKDGVALENLQLREGQPIGDLRVLITYGTLKLAGDVRFENGELPRNSEIRVIARPIERGRIDEVYAIADERGKFLLEGLSPEEYEVRVIIANASSRWEEGSPISTKRILLIEGMNGQIVFNINLEPNSVR